MKVRERHTRWLFKAGQEWQCLRDFLECSVLKLLFAVVSFFGYKEIAHTVFLLLERLDGGNLILHAVSIPLHGDHHFPVAAVRGYRLTSAEGVGEGWRSDQWADTRSW